MAPYCSLALILNSQRLWAITNSSSKKHQSKSHPPLAASRGHSIEEQTLRLLKKEGIQRNLHFAMYTLPIHIQCYQPTFGIKCCWFAKAFNFLICFLYVVNLSKKCQFLLRYSSLHHYVHQKALEGEICVKRRTANNAFIVIWIKANAKQPPWCVVASAAVVFAIRLSFCAQPQSQPVSLWGQLLCPRMGSRQQQLHKNQQTLKWIVVHTNKPVLSDCVISHETMLYGKQSDESNKMFGVCEWKSIFFWSFYAL